MPPTEPGFYWWRDAEGSIWQPCHVYVDGYALCARPLYCWLPSDLALLGGEWGGPCLGRPGDLADEARAGRVFLREEDGDAEHS